MGTRHVLLRQMQSSPRSVGRPLGTATMQGRCCSSPHAAVPLPAACRSPVMGWKALGEPVIKSQKIASAPAGEGRKEQSSAGVSRQGWVETTSQGQRQLGLLWPRADNVGSWGSVQSQGMESQMETGDFWPGPGWEGPRRTFTFCQMERNQPGSLSIPKSYGPSIHLVNKHLLWLQRLFKAQIQLYHFFALNSGLISSKYAPVMPFWWLKYWHTVIWVHISK